MKGKWVLCKWGGKRGGMKPLTLEERSTRGAREGEGEWNEEFLAVIYSGKNGAVILSYKLESYYF